MEINCELEGLQVSSIESKATVHSDRSSSCCNKMESYHPENYGLQVAAKERKETVNAINERNCQLPKGILLQN